MYGKPTKGHKSINVNRVTILLLCTECDDTLNLYYFPWKYCKDFKVMLLK